MHPNKVPCENPSKDEHICCAENETAKADPCKAGKHLKKRVMKLNAFYAPEWQKSAQETNYINNLCSEDAFPTVFFER